MIVKIPTEKLQRNDSDLIIQNDNSEYLNPQYVKGYVKIGVEDGKIYNIINKQEKQTNITEQSIENWENSFKEWERISSTSRLQNVKNSIIQFFKKEKGSRNKTQSETLERTKIKEK